MLGVFLYFSIKRDLTLRQVGVPITLKNLLLQLLLDKVALLVIGVVFPSWQDTLYFFFIQTCKLQKALLLQLIIGYYSALRSSIWPTLFFAHCF